MLWLGARPKWWQVERYARVCGYKRIHTHKYALARGFSFCGHFLNKLKSFWLPHMCEEFYCDEIKASANFSLNTPATCGLQQ